MELNITASTGVTNALDCLGTSLQIHISRGSALTSGLKGSRLEFVLLYSRGICMVINLYAVKH